MTTYEFDLEDYNSTSFIVHATAGTMNLVMSFNWDTEAQRSYDDIMRDLDAFAGANPLKAIGDNVNIYTNTDFLAYVNGLAPVSSAWLQWVDKYIPLLDSGVVSDLEWFDMEADLAMIDIDANLLKYSVVIFKEAQAFCDGIAALLSVIPSKDVVAVKAAYDVIDQTFISYCTIVDEQVRPYTEELEQLKDLLHWSVTITSQGIEPRTLVVHPGGWVFNQELYYSIMFTSPRAEIGLHDIGEAMMYVRVNDE